MRRINFGTATALALILPALMTNALAQEKKDQRGAAPAAHAAPAAAVQRVAPSAPAPAPHIAAPVAAAPRPAPVAQPHIAAPVQHIAAPTPHIAAPSHVAAPAHVATPQIAHTNVAHPSSATAITQQHGNGAVTGARDLAHRGGPTPANAANAKVVAPNKTNAATTAVTGPNKTNAATTAVTGPNKTNAATTAVTGPNKTDTKTVPNAAASKLAAPGKTIPSTTTPSTTTPNVAGQGPANRNAANQLALAKAQEQAQAQARARIYVAGRKPILQNQSFANMSARDPAMRALAHATFQGRFAQFRDHDRDRHERFADRRGFHGIVIGWGGPVFWPYAYADLVDYTFWPSANDTFWPYAYDDVYDGIFGAYAPDSTAYANVPAVRRRLAPQGPIATGVATGLAAGGMAQICSGQTSGLTDWPIERIAQQVGPTDAQRSLLDQLKDATARAVDLLKSACPTDLPSTPTGRLAAMRQRIEPMLQAVQIVRPALDMFYQSLSDEQKERFISLEAEGTPKATRSANRQPNLAQACGGSAKQITGLPISQIQQLLHPSDTQQTALDELNTATSQAAALLNENCSQDQALTPPGRVAAMETRLSAMLKALNTVQPAIAKFYNSLTDEQKARFDRLGPRQG
jgi:hypothetical protein